MQLSSHNVSRVDNFWPWANNKGEATTTYGKQHFRDVNGNNIAGKGLFWDPSSLFKIYVHKCTYAYVY